MLTWLPTIPRRHLIVTDGSTSASQSLPTALRAVRTWGRPSIRALNNEWRVRTLDAAPSQWDKRTPKVLPLFAVCAAVTVPSLVRVVRSSRPPLPEVAA